MFKAVLKLRSYQKFSNTLDRKGRLERSIAGKNFWVQGVILNTTSLKGEVGSLGDQGPENGDV